MPSVDDYPLQFVYDYIKEVLKHKDTRFHALTLTLQWSAMVSYRELAVHKIFDGSNISWFKFLHVHMRQVSITLCAISNKPPAATSKCPEDMSMRDHGHWVMGIGIIWHLFSCITSHRRQLWIMGIGIPSDRQQLLLGDNYGSWALAFLLIGDNYGLWALASVGIGILSHVISCIHSLASFEALS